MAAKTCHALLLSWVTTQRDTVGLLLEQLRYAGPVSCWETHDAEQADGSIVRYIFIGCASRGIDTLAWAKMNRSRMSSFSIRATIIARVGDAGQWYLADADGKPDYTQPVRT